MRCVDERSDEIVNDRGDRRIFGVVLNRFDDGGTDDDAVSFFGDFVGLLRRGDAKTDANGRVGVFFDGGDELADGFGRRDVGAGHAGARQGVDEAL